MIIKNKNYYLAIALAILAVFSIVFFLAKGKFFWKSNSNSFYFSESEQEGVLEEASSMDKSKSSEWWLNSGGILNISKEGFNTNMGPLAKNSSWRKLYAKNNSRDTDKGYYPQNLFRLVTRNKWKNISQEVYFNIENINLSKSDYRNESNGVLLFNRYQDGDNLYYTGLRVDGDAVIKKKIGGKYYTLKEKKVFESDQKYDRDDNPNLIPIHTWLGIKSEVKNTGKGIVNLKIYIDREQKGDWQLILEAEDKNDNYGKAPFEKAGYAGIRTDFMDIKFKAYLAKETN